MKTERRAVARYRVKLPVDLEMNGNTIAQATSTEISLAGIRIDCEGPVAGKILNRYLQVTPGENIAAKIQIKIPNNTGISKKIHCRTTVISVNRASQAHYIVGLKFLEFKEDGEVDWVDYISRKVKKV